MKVNPISVNNNFAMNTNFKANFVHNEISKDLMTISPAEDVAEFKKACEALKDARNNQYQYFLSGITSNYGVCSEAEIDDKFIDLSYRTDSKATPCFLQSWIIRNERIVSGGHEKKSLLKEITKQLKNIAKENAFKPAYDPEKMILKKASYVSKALK